MSARAPTPPPPEIQLFGEYAGDAATAEAAPLSWRQDKTQTFSDWAIVVKHDGGDDKTFITKKAKHFATPRGAP